MSSEAPGNSAGDLFGMVKWPFKGRIVTSNWGIKRSRLGHHLAHEVSGSRNLNQLGFNGSCHDCGFVKRGTHLTFYHVLSGADGGGHVSCTCGTRIGGWHCAEFGWVLWMFFWGPCKKRRAPKGCLGYLLGMENYPAMWGLFHKPWNKDPNVTLDVDFCTMDFYSQIFMGRGSTPQCYPQRNRAFLLRDHGAQCWCASKCCTSVGSKKPVNYSKGP